MAGKKSATLIFVIPIRFVPIIIIKIEPAQVISLMAPVLINGAINPASRTRRKIETVGSDKISAGVHYKRCTPAILR